MAEVRQGGVARPSTINDVAAAAGVSRQTVTRAMNNMPGISVETKERVLQAARELRYRPSRFGRGLVKQEHRTLGLVIDDLTNPYYPELASAVVGFAADNGWNVVLADTIHTSHPAELIADLTHQVDAVIGYLGLASEQADVLLAGMPVVEIDVSKEQTQRGSIVLDFATAMSEAVDHLLERGVRQPVMLDVTSATRPSFRARLFVSAMELRGLSVPVVRAEGIGLGPAAEATRKLLVDRPETDAIMAFNDITAFGALQALRQAGVAVPDRVKVIGIDGLSIGTFVSPQLTTLALDMTQVAQAAVETVLGMYAGTLPLGGPMVRRTVSHRLVIRESS
ncbi:LacI family DNA-binding transcriptional regulator [Microlunatus panaciterrae]|uniref:DNA-binding LacI/PurR family transcriptional regulator n=1 Tax=Microlunatus panaciterrae TaxID=400768 RepID=A0ABS2RQE5_9ACTN|nr:LacI family DNA-binding transcriptional regulator [Microlunatus panaciterrae]MBM7800149.1 DNA-binding LacI/PurR family transcriptional regulator [Microlunatus panaciterrae]